MPRIVIAQCLLPIAARRVPPKLELLPYDEMWLPTVGIGVSWHGGESIANIESQHPKEW